MINCTHYIIINMPILIPSETIQTCRALIHFLGGAIVGAAPDITYRCILELLARKGFLTVATPYSLSFDYIETCDNVMFIPQDDPSTLSSNRSMSSRSASNRGPPVPMQGHFRGIQNAQHFHEEEAGMDEIEGPSSSVVARMNQSELKRSKRSSLLKFVLLGI